jgi:putative ABC transport system ATP-binding protein
VIELRGVSKRYDIAPGREVIAASEVSLTIEAGEFVGLAGPSGAGKTTLLNLIGALDQPDSGEIISDGTDLTRLRGKAADRYRRTVGFVFQRDTLLPALTALDNVVAPVLPYRTRWNKRDRAADLLAAVGLAGREQALPAHLSGGERRRVAIARALINTPAVLLADEPTGNADAASAAEILDLLASLRIEHAMTVVLSSHDPQAAARCERLIRLAGGRVTDDIQLTCHEEPAAILRRIGQLG